MTKVSTQYPTPAHVPADRVRRFDLYDMDTVDADYHLGIQRLQGDEFPDIFWSRYNDGHWVFARGEDYDYMLNHPELFSSRYNNVPRANRAPIPFPPINLDPPEQGKYRALLMGAFSPKAIGGLTDAARALTISLIEGFKARGECEFVSEFALHLPIALFMKMLDLPPRDRAELLRMADGTVRPENENQTMQSFMELTTYCYQLIVKRRANPGPDLISKLTLDEVDGKPLSDETIVGILLLLMVAGLDTVASMLGFVTRFLARNPGHRRQLIEDPSRIPNAVEELLRRHGITTLIRVAAQDFEYKGVQIRKDDMVVSPSAVHGIDGQIFPDALRVDFDRKVPFHGTFGSGPHRCMGSMLARAELRIVLEEWLKRIPDFELAPDFDPGLRFGTVVTMTRLPLVWKPT